MRKEFVKALLEEAKKNPNIILLTGDLGFGLFDEFKDTLPEQFYNVGAAEVNLMTIAVGMSLEGKIPFVYSITTFLLYRPFEVIRNYIDHENIKVILVGSGRNEDYEIDGFSHNARDDYMFMKHFKNIKSVWPTNSDQAKKYLDEAIVDNSPYYINLTR